MCFYRAAISDIERVGSRGFIENGGALPVVFVMEFGNQSVIFDRGESHMNL